MHDFQYKESDFCCENVLLKDIAKDVGTPVYVYSHKTLTDHYKKLDTALSAVKHIICYSVKTNSNTAVCRTLIKEGAGVDIVSAGELFRAKKAGVDTAKVVYAGVGKRRDEIQMALESDILLFTVESIPELELINEVASEMDKKARVALRINPDVDAKTHDYITTGKKENKFGIDMETAFSVYTDAVAYPSIDFAGVHIHIGSQIVSSEPYVTALKKMKPYVEKLKEAGVDIRYFDIGGGLGIIYDREQPMTAEMFASAITPFIQEMDVTLILEPGRFISGNAGVFLTSVLYVKKNSKNFVIVDGAMNDLIRPSLYQAYHEIIPVVKNETGVVEQSDVVGPICESGDFLGKDRYLPELKGGDLVAVLSSGAYGFTMASNYNSRCRSAEVMVKGDEYFVIRERETYETLIKDEKMPEFLV